MSELKRTMSAGIPLARCLTFDEVEACVQNGTLSQYLIPVDQAISHLAAHQVIPEKVKAALQGQRLSGSAVQPEVMRSFLGFFTGNGRQEQSLQSKCSYRGNRAAAIVI
ncbi:tRNA pseudouridine synthase B [compost metagenome]